MDSLENLIEYLTNLRRPQEEEAKQRLSKVVAAKKAKFLEAIGKIEPNDEDVTEESLQDEAFVLEHLFWETYSSLIVSGHDPITFDDSIVTTAFDKLKRPEFDLKTYIGCVKWIYANYLHYDFDIAILDFGLNRTVAYVLSFARDLDDPSKDMFHFSDSGTVELTAHCESLPNEFTGNKLYIKKLNKLMSDLLESYSEHKYQQLNTNATYFVMIMMRRAVKTAKEFSKALDRDKIHSDYAELCPFVLDYRLPLIMTENNDMLDAKLRLRDDPAVLLLLYAYLKCGQRTKRALRATCLQHMEYNGLGVPELFFKVVKLYKVDESELWDMLSTDYTIQPLFKLSDLYQSQFKGAKEDPAKTYTLFPYCRVLNSYYHSDMSAKYCGNTKLCYVLACLVDLKMGAGREPRGEGGARARRAHWKHALSDHEASKLDKVALDTYEKLINGSS